MIEALGSHLAAEVAAFVHDEGVPGAAAAAVVPGEPAWSFGYGTADVASGRAMTAGVPMRVGSLTKPFTVAAILVLRDDGLVSLDDRVVEHLPEFGAVGASAPGAAEARIVDLLTHRAGVPGEVRALDEASGRYPTIEEVLAGIADVELLSPPGEATRYSNLGFQLLGEIVARRSGSPFEAFCRDRLFAPLGLDATGFDRPEVAARGHHARAFTDHVAVAADRRKRTNADGGLWSSAPDQARWIQAQLGGAPGLPDLRATHGPIRGSDEDGAPGQGLGWFRERRDARTVVYHQGSTPGFAARLAFSPPLGGGAVILVNGEAATAGVLGRLVDLVLDGIEGATPSEPAPPLPGPPVPVAYPPAWDELVGFYVWPGSATAYRLEVRSGRLRLVDLGDDRHPVTLDGTGTDRFVAIDGGWSGEPIAVRRDDAGAVRGLRIGAWSVTRLVEAGR